MRKKYLIYTPEYIPYIGGFVALHKLCHNLNVLGEEAYILPYRENFLIPIIGNPLTIKNIIKKLINKYTLIFNKIKNKSPFNAPVFSGSDLNDYIVIYPEIIAGNPLNAKNVVRWLLYYPDFHNKGVTSTWLPSDMIFSQTADITKQAREKFNLNVEKQELPVPFEFFFDIFKDEKLTRQGSCYTIRKGQSLFDKKNNYIPTVAVFINSNDIIRHKGMSSLAKIFNEAGIFYSYDQLTLLSVQAALCGCVSVVVPNEDKSSEEWHKNELFKYGVAYGKEEIPFAKKTMPLLKEHLLQLEKNSIVELKKFVEITQERLICLFCK